MNKAVKVFLLVLILGVLDVGIPYIFLRNFASFLGSYLFWIILTLTTIVWGILYTNSWGKAL